MNQHAAAREGDLTLVQQLVTRDNVDEKDGNGLTVLHQACKGGQPHVMEWLLGVGANVNVGNDDDWTPLHCAARYSHQHCIKLLLAAGADPGADAEGGIPLHFAHKSAACTALLIAAHPAGVFAVDAYGRTPLHENAMYGAVDACLLLLAAGSVVDAVDKHDRTSLYWALCKGKRDVAELLIDRGAQLERVKLDRYLEVIPEWAMSFVARRDSCRSSCLGMLELARRRSRVLGSNNRDVLGIIARMVWDSRCGESWKNVLSD